MGKIKILVADTRSLLLIALTQVLKDTPNIELVATCTNFEEAVHKAIETKPDVIVLDPGLVSCIEEINNIRQVLPEIRMIMFTLISPNYSDPLLVLDTKANGYIDLDISPTRIVEVIKRVFEGGYVISPLIAKQLIEKFALADKKKKIAQDDSLSKREREVLALVSQGLTNREIADTLFITESTAKAHLHSILTKMDVHSRAHAVFKARDEGFLTDQDSQRT